MEARASKRLSFGSASNCHRLSDGLHPFASPFALRSSEMTEYTTQSAYGDQRQLNAGTRRTPLNRSSFSAIMVTTSLMADESDAPANASAERERDHGSSAKRFFKRKFSIGSTD